MPDSASGTGSDFGMYEVSANGVVDTSFGSSGNGLVATDFEKGNDVANGVAIQPDGKIVLAGSATISGKGTIAALARYTSNGILDPTFGPITSGLNAGLVVSDLDGGGSSAFDAIAIQPDDGKIVAAGTAIDPAQQSQPVTVIARFIGLSPDITGLSPAAATQGEASFTLTVTGDNYVAGNPGSTVLWNGTALSTTFVSATELSAVVPASDVVQPGTARVMVSNPGNITSSAETFTIVAPPEISELSPASAIQGGAQFSLTVTGDNFLNGSTILWNSAALATAFVSSTGAPCHRSRF